MWILKFFTNYSDSLLFRQVIYFYSVVELTINILMFLFDWVRRLNIHYKQDIKLVNTYLFDKQQTIFS